MPTFPTQPSLRVIGPSSTIVLVVAQGVTDPPLQILNDDETGVAEIGIDGLIRTIAGSFWSRGPSIDDDVATTS